MDVIIAIAMGAASLVVAFLFGKTRAEEKQKLAEEIRLRTTEKRIRDAISNSDFNGNWRDGLRSRNK